MRTFFIKGMSCAACSNRVENAVRKVEGVDSVAVSLLTNSMNVSGSASDSSIIQAVKKAGYEVHLKNEKKDRKESEESDTKSLIIRLVSSIIVTLVLMYFSMGYLMWSFPLPSFFLNNHLAIGIIEMFLASIVLVINQRFFISGFKALIHFSPNMDTLVSLGSGISYLWSLVLLLGASGDMAIGNSALAMEKIHGLYFESSAMILTLISVGKTLEARSKGKTTDSLNSLVKLKVNEATVLIDGKEEKVNVDDIAIGDIFIVKAGEAIALDGTVIDGSAAVDESALTGESLPVEKEKGMKVFSSTINQSGFLKVRADRVGKDTTINQIIKIVEEASTSKAPIAKIADKVSGFFVPSVIFISLVVTIIWLFLTNGDISFALEKGISILVISCPCALGLATPVAIMVGSGVGAKNGILYKNATSLEALAKVKTVALDKTGTITNGKLEVSKIFTNGETGEKELLQLFYSLENKSDHPIAKAIIAKAKKEGLISLDVSSFKEEGGKGLRGLINGKEVICGNLKYISLFASFDESFINNVKEEAKNSGSTAIYLSIDGTLEGAITVSDTIKNDSKEAISLLNRLGLNTVVITGDNKDSANAILKDVDCDYVVSDVLPLNKAEEVRKLKKHGLVAMVGDGINDAPALIEADVGIAIGSGTDVAIDSAAIVLMKNSLMDVVSAFIISRATLTNIYENLFWAFIYNIVGIPIASGLLGLSLNPMFGALAMSLSSFCVVTNALRLNLVNIHKVKNRKKIKLENKELIMKKTMNIEGMMCEHCEARVKKTLCAIKGVKNADVDHNKGIAVVELESDVSSTELKVAVENEGYKVTGIDE